jgi:hypothetical protein
VIPDEYICAVGGHLLGRDEMRPVLEVQHTWHMQDSHGQILALAFRTQPLKLANDFLFVRKQTPFDEKTIKSITFFTMKFISHHVLYQQDQRIRAVNFIVREV